MRFPMWLISLETFQETYGDQGKEEDSVILMSHQEHMAKNDLVNWEEVANASDAVKGWTLIYNEATDYFVKWSIHDIEADIKN